MPKETRIFINNFVIQLHCLYTILIKMCSDVEKDYILEKKIAKYILTHAQISMIQKSQNWKVFRKFLNILPEVLRTYAQF